MLALLEKLMLEVCTVLMDLWALFCPCLSIPCVQFLVNIVKRVVTMCTSLTNVCLFAAAHFLVCSSAVPPTYSL